ncbi:GNAT family N-acetyltransferase [Sessilibacter sp. MAH2]
MQHPKIKFTCTLRKATLDDSEVLKSLWHKLDVSLPETPFIANMDYRQEFHEALAEQIESNKATLTLVAAVNELIVGCVCGYVYEKPEAINTPVGLIHNLWVEPEYRRKGVATQLVQSIEADLINSGAKSFQVAWRHTDDARRFWQKMGFIAYEAVSAKTVNN